MGSNFIHKTLENVHVIRNCLETVYCRQKSYADHRRRDLEFEQGDKLYLKISPMNGVIRFGKKGKLCPRYTGPNNILQKVDKVAYELRLPSEFASVHPIFHVSMLKKCVSDPESSLPIECLSVKDKFFY